MASGHDDGHGKYGSWLQHHFETPVQQFESAKLGMWLFLAQEVLFFSGLFVAYGVFRVQYPEAFEAGSAQLDRIIGGFNTCVLLISSFTAAMAVRMAHLDQPDHHHRLRDGVLGDQVLRVRSEVRPRPAPG